MSNITEAMDYIVDLKIRAMDIWLEETIEPLVQEAKKLENRIFEKAYKEVLELESESSVQGVQ